MGSVFILFYWKVINFCLKLYTVESQQELGLYVNEEGSLRVHN